MRETLENLWKEYFAEKCALIDTKKEKELAKKAVEKHKIANELMTKEQINAVEKYVDILCEIQDSFVRKAFFKGCEFTISFLMESGNFKS